MKNYLSLLIFASICLILAACSSGINSSMQHNDDTEIIRIGTGNPKGIYYPAGEAICRFVNSKQMENNLLCNVEETGGSIYNINAIRSGQYEFGIVQSDWQHHALLGQSRFAQQGPFEDLRAVFSLQPEPLTIIARTDSGVSKLEDLVGKRVNLGKPGSGQRTTLEIIIQAMGWTNETFAKATSLSPSEQIRALCNNELDVIAFQVGNPNGAIFNLLQRCPVSLVEVDNAAIRQLVADNDYYRMAIIPADTYPGQKMDLMTFGVGATVVTSRAMNEATVYNVTRTIFENLEAFKKVHPHFKVLNAEDMMTESISAPLHPGAINYFKEAGLMK